MPGSVHRHTQLVKEKARKYGFAAVGISKAAFLENEAPRLEKWLGSNMHGQMHYMANHFDKRLDPRLLVEGARSVVSMIYNYYSPLRQTDPEAPKISKYAYGHDYHHVIRDKLHSMVEELKEEIGEINGRAFVDSAPVLERAWAARSGLGWIGKNGNLINKGSGSFYFISQLIIDVELEADTEMATDHCGTCTACMDACPTQAIVSPKTVDGSKCISYFTIELKEQIPSEYKGRFDNWMFGCDVCQDVCPWNRFARPNTEPEFTPPEELLGFTGREWQEITEEVFAKMFKKSPVKRTGYNGLKRNIDFITN